MTSKWIIGALVVLSAVTIASLILAALTLTQILKNSDATNPGTTPTPSADACPSAKPIVWYDDACCTRTCEKGWAALPTLVISLDGFRADYLLHNRTSAIFRLAACGSHTPYMFPSYPSKTFPNHYAIVTGLYPESSGIIDNNMYDPTIEPPSDRSFSMSNNASHNPQWWRGLALTYAVNIFSVLDMTATYWYTYNGSTPFVTRVDRVIDWLLMDDSERPSIINVYFNEPDETGHSFGPISSEVDNQLVMVDGFMNYLMTRLHENGLFHCVNKIILADHGMEMVNNSNYVSLNDYIPYTEQVASNMRIFTGPVARIQLDESNYTADQVIDATRCKDERFRVYKRLETPKRLHYSATPRIGDVVLDADATVEIYANNPYSKGGDHGYDYKDASMHALLLAHGPAFQRNYSIPPFQNVELYNLLADLLALNKRAPTNGTVGSLYAMLRNPPEPPSRENLIQPQLCPLASPDQTKNCGDCSTLNQHSIDECAQPNILAEAVPERLDSLCSFEKQSIIYDNVTGEPVAVQSLISAKTQVTAWSPGGCTILQPLQPQQAPTQCTDIDAINKMLAEKSASMYPLQPFDSGENTCAADWYAKAVLYDGFFAGVWSYLQNMTLTYANAYGNLMVISGVIYDYDGNGNADSYDAIQQLATNATDGHSTVYFPSHAYQVLIRCENAQWTEDGQCSGNAAVMAFILPNKPVEDNCQSMRNYLYMNTARVRDIELLAGLEFFPSWPFETAVRLRIHVNQEFW